MHKNSQNFDMQEAMRLAQSPAGKQLLAMLQKSDANHLQQAKKQADAGDYTAAMHTVKQLLNTEQGRELLKKLGG